ncbi:MAG: GNAT family N-acetyltransferase [Propionibacteriaceae bacterium]|nr:GNAT family N-acetyltransferase [Propionibacteriaceae bacterium]
MIVETVYRQERNDFDATVTPSSPADVLERLLDLTWPGTRRARLGEWVLRTGNNQSGRANSVLACGDPGVAFEEAERLVESWAGRRMQLQAVLGSKEHRLAEVAGYSAFNPTVVMVMAAREFDGPAAVSSHEPDSAWRRISNRSSAPFLAEFAEAPARYLRLGDEAVGRVAVFQGWGVLTNIEVRPESRGRGLGRSITRALMTEAVHLGARFLALQVEQDNTVARRLYKSKGFTEHHRYAYLARRG